MNSYRPKDVRIERGAYLNMLYRCYNPKHKQFKDYGGRNITVCASWLMSFENFLADMGRRPQGTSRKDEWSLDRIDNDKNYEPSNCKWSTRKQQMANRRNAHLHCYHGIEYSRRALAEFLGRPYSTVKSWIVKNVNIDAMLLKRRYSTKPFKTS